METETILTIDGDVRHRLRLSYAQLAALAAHAQHPDVSRLDPRRSGRGVSLAAILELAEALPAAAWLTLHAGKDDFHASVPLAAVREQGVLIYGLGGGPLPAEAGGPIRFLIPDHAACRTADVDECANVKFVDRIELSRTRGQDNRPQAEAEHAALHARQQEHPPAR
ncbi:MAG TPA: molybdopterin-dependent oxidoreductase [Pirellulales bacterium]|nr:molybdopterin-dependent oxidoreductase [Pirellulales bacterium]